MWTVQSVTDPPQCLITVFLVQNSLCSQLIRVHLLCFFINIQSLTLHRLRLTLLILVYFVRFQTILFYELLVTQVIM